MSEGDEKTGVNAYFSTVFGTRSANNSKMILFGGAWPMDTSINVRTGGAMARMVERWE
jgi:hypothetical protein